MTMRKRHAFTLIELVVVIGIISLMIAMLVIGIGKLQASAKRRQNAQIMENCRSIFGEYDAAKRPSYHHGEPLWCPGNVSAELSATNDRFGVTTVITQAYLKQFGAMPVNAAAMGKFTPAEMTRQMSGLPNPSPWTQGSNYIAWDIAGGRVYDPDANSRWICIQSHISTLTTEPPNPDFWIYESPKEALPLLLDAWGNPIIFVPWGLGRPMAWTPGSPVPPGVLIAGDHAMVMTSIAPINTPLLGQQAAINQPSRPFFASAGPDGDFSKGDDNVYSFDK